MKTADAMFRRRDDGLSDCTVCGSVVADERLHKKWHRESRR